MTRLRWFAVAAVCLGAAVSYIPICSALLQHRARTVLRNISTLYGKSGTPTLVEAQRLFDGKLQPISSCKPEECSYRYELNNRALSKTRWVPFSEIEISMWVENGYVRTVIVDFTSTANESHSVVSHLYIQDGGGPIQEQTGLEFDLDPWEESSPADTNGIVGVSAESFRVHEAVVLGFDVRCLARRGGCCTVADLLPTVWEVRNNGEIRCRLPNHEGFIEDPFERDPRVDRRVR